MVGLKQIAIVLVSGFVLVGGGAVATGVVNLQQPVSIASQFDEPTAGVLNFQFESQSGDETTVNITYFIDNPNPISGEITKIEYDLFWNNEEHGEYAFMGTGQDKNVKIPNETNITEHSLAVLQSDQAASAFTTKETQGFIWVKVDIEVTFDFGPQPIKVDPDPQKILVD